MMKRMILATTAAMAMVMFAVGCGSSLHGIGPDAEARYTWGTLEATLMHPLGVTHEAARVALTELQITVLQDECDHLAGQLLAHDAHEDTISIRLKALPESRTRMTIRIGTFGDKSKSSVIFNQIMGNLRQIQ